MCAEAAGAGHEGEDTARRGAEIPVVTDTEGAQGRGCSRLSELLLACNAPDRELTETEITAMLEPLSVAMLDEFRRAAENEREHQAAEQIAWEADALIGASYALHVAEAEESQDRSAWNGTT